MIPLKIPLDTNDDIIYDDIMRKEKTRGYHLL